MRHIDASAVLDLWEYYPIRQFPAVWEWFAEEFTSGELGIVDLALDEVGFRDPACKAHLEAVGVAGIIITTQVAAAALSIKSALGIVNDGYGSGVDENDILIVATAKVHGAELITNEGRQVKPPTFLKNCKIPAVAAMSSVSVVTMRLIDYIRQSGQVFR